MSVDSSLQYQWLLAGVVAAGGRFVPVPILDDVLREQADAFVVRRTLAAHGIPADSAVVSALRGRKGMLRSALGFVLGLPLKVLLYPIRKIVRLLGAARGVPRDAVRPLVLGRAVDRVARRGSLSSGKPKDNVAAARAASKAFELTWKRFDGGPLAIAIADSVRASPGLASAAYRLALKLARGEKRPEEPGAEPAADALPRGFEKLFADFDREFDAALEAGA